ncbi:MAG TPA: Uma2 family endonuclease [Kofleriaceae bacterium]|nr:Uma2 family endonuclease [Kofleriaceae bacterium]
MKPDLYDQFAPVPLAARFPIELRPPAGFQADDPSTWPTVAGRLEYVGRRLLYMPPSGGIQQGVSASVVAILVRWAGEREGFWVGGNEAGMLLDGDVRAADAAVWRRTDSIPGGYLRIPPVLVAEIAGQDDGEDTLRDKAAWYLQHGVSTVWLVLPAVREVVVVRADREARYGPAQSLAADPAVPGLEPVVASFFAQLD